MGTDGDRDLDDGDTDDSDTDDGDVIFRHDGNVVDACDDIWCWCTN